MNFEESGCQSLLVIVASKKYASFNTGKENFGQAQSLLAFYNAAPGPAVN